MLNYKICFMMIVLFFILYGQVLQNLIEMGFDEKDALEALRISRNNQNDAVSVSNKSTLNNIRFL